MVKSGVMTNGTMAQPFNLPAGYGSGTPGTGGEVPKLDTRGRLAYPGSTNFCAHVWHLVGGSSGFLLVGFGQTSVPLLGIDRLVNHAATLTFASQAGGVAGVLAWAALSRRCRSPAIWHSSASCLICSWSRWTPARPMPCSQTARARRRRSSRRINPPRQRIRQYGVH
ncbi:MAG: hypothetical protein P1V81_05275 [Planctomycetota bacterium]|nr:hypothetical protein [Planctomycetota bacterium]